MAIIEAYHGIKVGIRDARDAKRDLPEYPDASGPSSSQSRLTRYIACRDAQEFLVHLSVSNAYDFSQPTPHSLNLAVYIDGAWAAGKLCRVLDTRMHPFHANINHRLHRYFDGTCVRQPFVFSGVKTVEDTNEDRLEAEMHMADTLGTIEIRVFRVQEQGIDPFQAAAIGPRAFEFAEVSLKGRAITHGTIFRDGDNLTKENADNDAMMWRRQCDFLDKHPMAVYHFKYRSHDVLQQMGVMSKEDLLASFSQKLGCTPRNEANEMEQNSSRCRRESFQPKRPRDTKADQYGASGAVVVDLTDEPPSERPRQRGDGAQAAIDLTDE